MPDEQTLTQREGASAAPSPAASGTGLELKSLTKRFGEDVAAVDDINLHIAHGEGFMTDLFRIAAPRRKAIPMREEK